MKVQGSWWNGGTDKEKRNFYGGKIKEYSHDKRRWLIEFDNEDEDQFMRYEYDCVLRYTNKDPSTFHFHNFKLSPANPILPPGDEVIYENEEFVNDKPNWTEIFKYTNHPAIPDMTSIPFTGEREEFDVDITDEEINSIDKRQ